MNATTTATKTPETCCDAPEVWVINTVTFHCATCGHESPTGHARPTNIDWENDQ